MREHLNFLRWDEVPCDNPKHRNFHHYPISGYDEKEFKDGVLCFCYYPGHFGATAKENRPCAWVKEDFREICKKALESS